MHISKNNFINKLRCTKCKSGKIDLLENEAVCRSCNSHFPLLNSIINFYDTQNANSEIISSQPKLFDNQKLYEFINFTLLRRFNSRIDIDINKYIEGKEVLDIGCGPKPNFYDPALTSLHAGVDLSLIFLQRSSKILPNSVFLKASADNLPFSDNTFDVALFLFTLHHIPVSHALLLKEAYRITREIIIVFDHNQSSDILRKFLKEMWWKIKDKGFKYNNKLEWEELLREYNVKEKHLMGKFLENVFEFIIIKSTI